MIHAYDHQKDTVLCGTGHDTVVADRIDFVAKDCEKVTRKR